MEVIEDTKSKSKWRGAGHIASIQPTRRQELQSWQVSQQNDEGKKCRTAYNDIVLWYQKADRDNWREEQKTFVQRSTLDD